jgi:hypothetical protein
MADQKAKVVITGEDQTKKATDSVKAGLRGVESSTKGLTTSLTNMGKALLLNPIVLSIASFAGLVKIIKGVSSAAQDQEDALNKLGQAMKNNGTYTDTAFQSAVNFSEELMNTTVNADEAIQSVMALINSMTGLTNEGLNKATAAAADLASGLGVDLESAGSLISKTLSSSTNALGRYGLEVKGAAGSSERLASLTEAIAAKFGGRAAAETNTFSGKIKQLKNNFGELGETIGNTENSALMPFINTINEAIINTNAFAKAFLGGGNEVEQLESKLASLRAGLKVLESQSDPLGTYAETIKKRKNEILITEITLANARNAQAQTTSKDQKKQGEIDRKNAIEALKIKNAEQLKDAIEKAELEKNKVGAIRDITTQEQIDSLQSILDKTGEGVEGRQALEIQLYKLKGQLRKDDLESQLIAEEATRRAAEDSFFAQMGLSKERNQLIEKNNLGEMKSAEELGAYIIGLVKRRVIGEITIEEQAAIAKASMALATSIATLNFPGMIAAASQLAVPTAIAGAKIAAVNAVPFADGGSFVIDRPTVIPMAGGKRALVGEAGPEQINVTPAGAGNIIRIENVLKIGEREFYRQIKDVINKGDRGLL